MVIPALPGVILSAPSDSWNRLLLSPRQTIGLPGTLYSHVQVRTSHRAAVRLGSHSLMDLF